jgi:hypothetical protein
VQGTSFLSQIVPLIESSQAFRPRRSESCGSFRARACEPPAARPGGSQNRRAAGGRDGIRHYGFLANGARTEHLARCCRLLNLSTKPDEAKIADETTVATASSPGATSPSAPTRPRHRSLRHLMSPLRHPYLPPDSHRRCGRSSRRHRRRYALPRSKPFFESNPRGHFLHDAAAPRSLNRTNVLRNRRAPRLFPGLDASVASLALALSP